MRSNELGVDVQGNERVLLEKIKELESQGYQFEAAEGSFELLGRRSAPGYKPPFEVLDVVVISERRRGNSMFAEATVKMRSRRRDGSHGGGGRRAGARARRRVPQGAEPALPDRADIHLVDYKVRILDPEAATGAKTRVLIEAARGEERWSTIGVSSNIIEASATALADALELPLARARAAGAAETKKAAS